MTVPQIGQSGAGWTLTDALEQSYSGGALYLAGGYVLAQPALINSASVQFGSTTSSNNARLSLYNAVTGALVCSSAAIPVVVNTLGTGVVPLTLVPAGTYLVVVSVDTGYTNLNHNAGASNFVDNQNTAANFPFATPPALMPAPDTASVGHEVVAYFSGTSVPSATTLVGLDFSAPGFVAVDQLEMGFSGGALYFAGGYTPKPGTVNQFWIAFGANISAGNVKGCLYDLTTKALVGISAAIPVQPGQIASAAFPSTLLTSPNYLVVIAADTGYVNMVHPSGASGFSDNQFTAAHFSFSNPPPFLPLPPDSSVGHPVVAWFTGTPGGGYDNTVFSPNLQAPIALTPSAAALALGGNVPVVAGQGATVPNVGTLSLIGAAVQLGLSMATQPGSLGVGGAPPSVISGVVTPRQPAAAALALAGAPPTVSATSGGGGTTTNWYDGLTITVTPPPSLGTFGSKSGQSPTIWDNGNQAALGSISSQFAGGHPNGLTGAQAVGNMQLLAAPFTGAGTGAAGIGPPHAHCRAFYGGCHYLANSEGGGSITGEEVDLFFLMNPTLFTYPFWEVQEYYYAHDKNWWFAKGPSTVVFNGTIAIGSNVITGVAAADCANMVANLAPTLAATGLPSNAAVTAVGTNTVTMNVNATASGTVSILYYAFFLDNNTKTYDLCQGTTPYGSPNTTDLYCSYGHNGANFGSNTSGVFPQNYNDTGGQYSYNPSASGAPWINGLDNNGHNSVWNVIPNPTNPANTCNGNVVQWVKVSRVIRWDTPTTGFFTEYHNNGLAMNYQGHTLKWGGDGSTTTPTQVCQAFGGYARNYGPVGTYGAPFNTLAVAGSRPNFRYYGGGIYADRQQSGLARFVLSNSSTWAPGNGAWSEPLPYSAWAPLSANLQINVGNNSIGAAYVYFVDEANNIAPTIVATGTLVPTLATDPFPRCAFYGAGGSQGQFAANGGNTFAGISFAATAAYYNLIVTDGYIGVEPLNGQSGQTYAAVEAVWKANALANGIKLRTMKYVMSQEQSAPGGSGNAGSFAWWTAACQASTFWLLNSWPGGTPQTADANSYQLQMGSSSTQTCAASVNGFASPLAGDNIWQTMEQYYYDVWVNGLSASKYHESQAMAANPNLDGFMHDNWNVNTSVGGAWLQTTTSYGAGSATANQAAQQGYAKYAQALRAINPNFLVGGNSNMYDQYGNGSFVLDPSNNGILDNVTCEGYWGVTYGGEYRFGAVNGMKSLIFAEAQRSPIGTLVVISYGLTNAAGQLGIAQSSWTALDYQDIRGQFACCMMRNWHYCPNLNNSLNPNQSIVLAEMKQGSLCGWLGQPLPTAQGQPQTAAWTQGVWRRDFQNGTILWNPRGNGVQTLTVGSGATNVPSSLSYIANTGGYGDATRNTGLAVSGTVVLQDGGHGDGIFLIGVP